MSSSAANANSNGSGSATKSLEERAKDYFSKFDLRTFRTHQRNIQCVGFSADSVYLAVGFADPVIHLYTPTNQELGECKVLQGHTKDVVFLAWAPGKIPLLATVSLDKTLKIWDARSPHKAPKSINLADEPVMIRWTPDGHHVGLIVKGTGGDKFISYDYRTEKKIAEKNLNSTMYDLVFTPNGDQLLFASHKGTIVTYQYPNLRTTGHPAVVAHTTYVNGLAYEPLGKHFATAGGDSLVGIWDAQEQLCVRTLYDMDKDVRAVCFSHCSRFLAYGGDECTINIVAVDSGESVCKIERVPARIGQIAWNNKWVMAIAPGYTEDEKDDRTNRDDLILFGMRKPN
eukprot:comp20385_c0_seq1/m.25772 comp20385_c0_seq1/g.25772  ORF comp20385_c0_seq1/g.25772 comp20385_c0_seq1/m.25772 type:complete len:343 (-) comp20385_c0_seq1:2-1030(-)